MPWKRAAHQPGRGGRAWLLSNAMFTQGVRSKVVTALAQGAWIESAPDYLQGLPYEDLTQTDETYLHRAYTALLQSLTGMTETAPPLGLSTLPLIITLPMPHRMPYRSLGGRFAGRIEALWALHDVGVVIGTGGLGKTQLAIGSGLPMLFTAQRRENI